MSIQYVKNRYNVLVITIKVFFLPNLFKIFNGIFMMYQIIQIINGIKPNSAYILTMVLCAANPVVSYIVLSTNVKPFPI